MRFNGGSKCGFSAEFTMGFNGFSVRLSVVLVWGSVWGSKWGSAWDSVPGLV